MKIYLFFIIILFDVTYSNCQKQTVANSYKVKKVLILGNSIVYHAQNPSIGWNGNWGMAATSENKDFVHILENKILKISPDVTFSVGNIASSFERVFWKFNASEFESFSKEKPDLIIIKIGENINDSLIISNNLEGSVQRLLKVLSAGRSNVKVCFVGSFWPRKNSDVIQRLAKENEWIYIPLEDLYLDKSNTAIGQFENPSIERHPSDKGMAEIAQRIWQTIQSCFEDKNLK